VGELLASARLEFQAGHAQAAGGGRGRAPRARAGRGEAGPSWRCRRRPLPFVADPTLIARALANLIDNARKHGGGLDGIAVRGGRRTVVFEVSDPRSRASRPATRRACSIASTAAAATRAPRLARARPGAGPRIAVAHGGRADAGNRPGGGARVTLELPVARAALDAAAGAYSWPHDVREANAHARNPPGANSPGERRHHVELGSIRSSASAGRNDDERCWTATRAR
jgi:hypothetical protein